MEGYPVDQVVYDLTQLSARILVGVVLLAAGVGKFLDVERFDRSLRALKVLPAPITRPMAHAVPCLEIVVAIAMLTGRYRIAASWSAVTFFALFSIVLVVPISRRKAIDDCGCFPWRSPVTFASVIRNVGFAFLSAGTLAVGTAGWFVWVGAFLNCLAIALMRLPTAASNTRRMPIAT